MKATVRNDIPREKIKCPKCGKKYRLGRYDKHVRRSPSSNHDIDRRITVDEQGNVTRAKFGDY